jgi:hypothetical protein
MRTALSLRVLFWWVSTAFTAPVEPAPATELIEPSAQQRAEREVREALPLGAPRPRVEAWLRARNALVVRDMSSPVEFTAALLSPAPLILGYSFNDGDELRTLTITPAK